MVGKTSVVTPERFASGLTYSEYLGQIKVNKDRFEHFYDQGKVSSEDADFFRKAAKHHNGPAKMLVIGEDWCPDVYRGMPAMARIAEAGGLEMRVFPRDQHLDIANEFLKNGEFLSIPVAVFYTKEMRYICHWIERPVFADRERAQIQEEVKRAMPGADDQAIRGETRTKTQARQLVWLQESIKEMRHMVAEKVGLK
ncbi:MAG: thioredoxin family protein [Dehalococcoidia bacterium]|nr:thioredoxin family protein [Dehalococcoidia bacterium]